MLSRRFSSFLAIVSLISGLSALLAGCNEGPTGPTHFTILSPGETRITVLPGAAVHFQVQLNATGFRVEFEVDGEKVHEGPVFDFTPILVEHRVRISVIPIGSTAAPDVREFTVGVAVPGNEPPTVSSFGHFPEIAEALRDTFTFNLSAADVDGSLERVVLDFGDGTDPVTLSGGLLGGAIQQEHVFPEQGTYVVRAIVFDDDGVAVDIRDTVEALPPNQLPTGSLTLQGATQGDAPLTLTIRTSGRDSDGQIVKWELDTGGGTFEEIQPNETVQVTYAFREDPYVPRLRLTDDDGDASVIEADDEILVFLQVNANDSQVTPAGNPQLSQSGNPVILADGQDVLTFTVDVVDPAGNALGGVPIRIMSLREPLVAPDGTNLGPAEGIQPDGLVLTDSNGRATIRLTSDASTRLEAVPDINSIPFDVRVEASRGHDDWKPLEMVTGIETETTVSLEGGNITITKPGGGGYCAGDTVEIRVEAQNRSGGPARGKYTELRFAQFVNQVWFGARPGPGYGGWRTDSNGAIVFRYQPTDEDDDRLIAAWVDGNRLSSLGAFNFRPGC